MALLRFSAIGSAALAFAALLGFAGPAAALPTHDPHGHGPGSVTWAQNPIPPNDPDTTNHQHNSTLDIRGANGAYDGYAVWDSETLLSGYRDTWRYPVGTGNAPVLGVEARTYGHGYIAGDAVSAIEYAFVGAGWDADNKALLNAAFAEWEFEAKNRANGTTVGQAGALVRRSGIDVGINFDEDTLFTFTNFEVRWANIGGAGLAGVWYPDDSPVDPNANDLELVFNSNALFNNVGLDTDWSSSPEANEWDFYSVALHEIGHVLGLHHFAAGDGSNLMSAAATSFGIGDEHRFIDTADLQGAVDLYAIPEPGSLGLLALGLVGLVGARRRVGTS